MFSRKGRLIYTALALTVSAILIAYAVPETLEAFKTKPWDGLVDWTAARAFLDHKNPYSPEALRALKVDGLGHPPSTSFYAIPFALLPLSMMSTVLGSLIIALLFLQFFLIARELKIEPVLPTTLLLGSATIATSFMHYHFYVAQISELIGFLMVLGWFLLRRNRDLLAGLALGFACTLKLYPGVVMLYLLFSRRLKVCVVATLTYVGIAAFMTSRFGLIAWKQYADTEKIITDYWIGSNRNASLIGIVLRILRPACLGQGRSDPRATAISIGVGIVLIAIGCWLAHRARNFDLSYNLFCAMGAFMNPFFFEHYLVLLTMPLTVAGWTLFQMRQQLSRTAKILGALAVGWSAVCMSFPIAMQAGLFRGYRGHGQPWLHFQIHFFEVSEWTPAVLLMIVLGLLLYRLGSSKPALSSSAGGKMAQA